MCGLHLDAVGVAIQQLLEQLLCLVKVAQVVVRSRCLAQQPVAAREVVTQRLHAQERSSGGSRLQGGQPPCHARPPPTRAHVLHGEAPTCRRLRASELCCVSRLSSARKKARIQWGGISSSRSPSAPLHTTASACATAALTSVMAP